MNGEAGEAREAAELNAESVLGLAQEKSEASTDEGALDEAAQTRLFKSTQGAFHNALVYALQVAGEKEGQPGAMSQTELASLSGVSRHSIGNYLSNTAASKNPDLNTLCRIAAALKISPALLIMTKDDWTQLANAAHNFVLAFEDPGIQQAVEKLNESNNPRANDRAEGGLQVAQRAGLYNPVTENLGSADITGELREEIMERERAQRRAIRVSSAIAPLQNVKPAYHGPLLWLTSYLGATSFRLGEQ